MHAVATVDRWLPYTGGPDFYCYNTTDWYLTL